MNISALQAFYRGFNIIASEGNNAFSFDQRSLKSIYVPSLIKGSLADVKVGRRVVFSDMIGGEEVDVCGLECFVHIERPGQDIFIFDNHNHAFAFWAAGFYQGVIAPGSALVHVDQHKDTRAPLEWYAGHGVFDACHYANHILNVGNFIPPAVKAGWFKDVVQVQHEFGEADLIHALDVDLDVFAPVMEYIPEELKISRLRAWIERASFITFATSPFFMDQAKAIGLIYRLLE